jgi:hypothetical protein
MNKNFWISLVCLVLVSPSAHAEIIVLKDYTVINAKIVEQDDKQIKVNENGKTLTYEVDQIKSIDGKPFGSLVKEPGADPETPKSEPTKDKIQETNAGKSADVKPLSKTETIKKFIDIFGTRESMTQNFERMLLTIPLDKSQEIRKILNVDEVINNIIPLYDKHFTQEELDSYVAFFSSPQGQKFLKTLPIIMRESVDVNVEYFKSKIPNDAK